MGIERDSTGKESKKQVKTWIFKFHFFLNKDGNRTLDCHLSNAEKNSNEAWRGNTYDGKQFDAFVA